MRKIEDYKTENYVTLLSNAIENLPGIVQSKEFSDQMRRFIDAKTIANTIEIPEFRDYLITTVNGIFKEMRASLVPDGTPNSPRFRM